MNYKAGLAHVTAATCACAPAPLASTEATRGTIHPSGLPDCHGEKTDMANGATLRSRLINGWAQPNVPTRVCGRTVRSVVGVLGKRSRVNLK
jgi:hypothetical protein